MRPKIYRSALLLAALCAACLARAAPVRAAGADGGWPGHARGAMSPGPGHGHRAAGDPATRRVAAADATPATDAGDASPPVTATFIRSQWHSLFLGDEKIGYTTQSLYRLSDGGHRLKCNAFLRARRGEPRFGFYRKTTADVDARFRPQAVTCEVRRGTRYWLTTGRTKGGVLHLERTVDRETATAAIPIEDGMTFRCWAVPATVMSGTAAGATRRWLAVDASLGAVLPDQVLVSVLGPHTFPGRSEDDESLHGTAIMSVCGPEQIAHLVDDDGRVLRRLWQSSPMVAEAAALSEARRLDLKEDPPPSAGPTGFSHRGYRSDRLGLSLYVPPAPYACHVVPETGAIRITDLTDEAQAEIRPVLGPAPPLEAAAAGDSDGEGQTATPLLATHPVYKAWAARFDEVTAEPSRATVPGGAKGAHVLGVAGTARLGCTTFHYRNLLLWGAGLTWFLTIQVADRPVQAKPMLSENVVRSLRIVPPEGRLPLQTIGTTVRSPLYGFQVRRPSERWTVPQHTGGLPTALELARTDQAAVAVIRMMNRDPDRTLQEFVRQQAKDAARRLGVRQPVPKPAMLGGLPGYEIAYEGDGILSGRRAACTAVYVRRRARVLALVLVVRAGAGNDVRDEVEALRKSVQFLH